MKSILKWGFISAGIIIGGLVFYAIARTWNKTEIEFLIHINEELVQQSVFGESPTFAIWLEDPDNGQTYTAYATRRVATGDWEGKADVPVALPLWSEINRSEKSNRSSNAGMAGDEIIKIKYEEFVREPVAEFAKLATFLNKDVPDTLNDYLRTNVRSNSVGKGRIALGEPVVEKLRPLIADTLDRYDYE